MKGTWTVGCPRGGVYAGKGHYVNEKDGFHLHLRKVVTIKPPRGGSCEAIRRKHGSTPCELRNRHARTERQACTKKMVKKCGKTCDAETVCRAIIPCD